MGFNGSFEIKDHPWFKHYPWNELDNKRLSSPFIPEKKDNYDKRYCEAIEKLGLETKARYEQYKANQRFECAFDNFTFYNVNTEEVSMKLDQSSQSNKFQYEKSNYDYTKKRCQSALGYSTKDNEREIGKGFFYQNAEMNKINSKKNIFINTPQAVVNSPVNSNGIKLSSYCNNNYTIQKAKTIAVYHQYQPVQNKIPIPTGKKAFMKSISNLGVSPYSTKNSKKTTEDSSVSALSMLRTGSNLYKHTNKSGENKHIRTGSLVNTQSTTINTNRIINKAPLGLQRSSSNYGLYAMKHNSACYNTNGFFSPLNQANLHSTMDNKPNAGQKIISNININNNEKKTRVPNLNPSSSSSALLKNYRTNSYSLNSTGGSSRSKIIR